MAAGSRLIGREQELGLASSVLASGRVLVLGGHAGVGKTRLARELVDRWEGPSEWISGAAGTSDIPFGAVVRLLGDVDREPAPGSTARELDVIRAAIAVARTKPDRLLVIDDCHQLDDLSALLVHQLVLDRSVPMLLTVRTGEPVAAVLRTLWTDDHAERIDLLPLSPLEARALSADLLGGDLEERTAVALFESSSGNPLLLTELVRDAAESGRLHRADGAEGWRWDGGIGAGRHLRDAISTRLAGLGRDGHRAVSLLALAGHLGRSLLQRLVPGLDIDDAERRGLVAVLADGRRLDVQLGHPLLGEVLLTEATDLDELRIELADAIAAAGGRRQGDLLVLARLKLDAGGVGTDVELMVRAASRALLLGALDLTTELARAVIDAGGPPTAQLLLGEALLIDQRDDEAVLALEPILDQLPSDAERVRCAHALQNLYFQRGADEAAQRALTDRALAVVVDPVWRAVVEGNDVQHAMMSGRTATARARGEALLARVDDPLVRLRLLSSVGSGRALAGDLDDAFAFVTEMFPLALSHQRDLPLAPAWALNAQVMAQLLAGQLSDAAELLDMVSGLGASGTGIAGGARPWLALFGGRIDLARGRATDAATKLTMASAGFGDDDPGGFHRWARSLEAEALALTGDLDRARAIARDASASRSRMPIYDGEALRARLWVDALDGELTRAIDGLLELAALQQLAGQHALELYTLHDVLRLGAGPDVAERLLAVAGIVDASCRWSAGFTAHVAASRSGRGADYDETAAAFAAMDAKLHAAEAFAAAHRAYEAEGLRTRSAAAARQRDALLAEIGPVRTPLLQDVAARVELTRREREVVELAAKGASNKEIADRLFVSVRTAEGHLYRAMTKLGVTDRSELPDVIA